MSDQRATENKACRVCNSTELRKVVYLGNQHVSDFVTSDGTSVQAPLELVLCKGCGLIQLRDTFSRKSLYRHYWYKSGISTTMRKALEDIASKACEIARPTSGDLVVDIGCNDGTLLRSYKIEGLSLVGFEPAENLVNEARKGTTWVFNDFFSAKIFTRKFTARKAKIVTSVAMFYDLDDPNSFAHDIATILDQDGVWIVQQNYLATMLEQNGFDNIGHEHLEYYCLGTMQTLLERHGLEVFEVETNDVNGGSFRTYISHRGTRPIGNSLETLKNYETRLALDRPETYERFASNISEIRSQIREFVGREVQRGRKVYVYGASNRGNTILQYCGLDHTLIMKAADANPEKWGRKTAGTLIPIVSKEEARRDNPDYFLILPHHFLAEITRDEKKYLESGGRFIVPLPKFRVIGNDG
jgi:NDP-4-keto-2,6-dideoxyhexose 3-C-methyltransferase